MTAHFTGTSGTPDSTTSYYMGGAYEVKDSAVKKYYSIAGMMVAVKDGTGLQYLLTDHLGSTVAVTNSSGTLTSQQRYLPFGAPRTIPNSPILGTDFTFTGQRDLGDMGLMDYDARFYSQSLGRFIQPDTIIPSVSIPQTWNRYSYTQNNPTRFVDPSGHFIETLFDVAMILVDVADIAKNGLNVSNGAALILDVAAVIIPGVPAVGGLAIKAAKAANAVDNAMDAAKLVNKADNLADTAKALKNGAEELGTCLVNSFKADTDVETSEGPKDISAIQIGDYVLAWDETRGTLGYYEVTNAFHHTDAVVTEVILSGEWIETTPEHPFYVEGEGWVYAEDLQIGDEVRQADGTTGIVWLKWNVYKTQEMYNLTVDTAHTFFVGEGQWLVHNACDPLSKLPTRSPNDKTSGILNAGGEETSLISGLQGPASQMPQGSPGFDLITRTHVEGHASALMRLKGWVDGILTINNPPCKSCSKLLPRMLPPNSSLRIIGPNGYDKIFRGLIE